MASLISYKAYMNQYDVITESQAMRQGALSYLHQYYNNMSSQWHSTSQHIQCSIIMDLYFDVCILLIQALELYKPYYIIASAFIYSISIYHYSDRVGCSVVLEQSLCSICSRASSAYMIIVN